jgi:hypothetical protein
MAHSRSFSRRSPVPIDHGSLGMTPLLSEADLQSICKKTDLNLRPQICESKFLHCLNTTVERTIREQLEERLDTRTLNQLKRHFDGYKELSRSLNNSEFPPLVPPQDWVKEVEVWFKLAKKGLRERASGGAPNNVLQKYFYPRALGLFHAAFGVTPDATVSWGGRSERGATFRFLRQTTNIVHDRIRERGFSNGIPDHLQAKVNWRAVSDDAIGKRIEAAMKLGFEGHSYSGRTRPDGGKVLRVTSYSQLAWVYQSDFFQIQLIKD